MALPTDAVPADIEVASLRTSRISAVLNGLSALLFMAALIWSYLHLRHAHDDFTRIEAQVSEKRTEVSSLQDQQRALKGDISHLQDQQRSYAAALNEVVSGNQQAAQTLTRSAETSSNIARSIPRIFVHSSDTHSELALAVVKELRSKGYIVVGPDRVSNRFDPTKIEVQFFWQDGSQVNDLVSIEQILTAAGVPSRSIYTQLDVLHHHPQRTYALYFPQASGALHS